VKFQELRLTNWPCPMGLGVAAAAAVSPYLLPFIILYNVACTRLMMCFAKIQSYSKTLPFATIRHEDSVGLSVCKVHISTTRWRFYT
jgi:hypothetical protein